MTQPQKSWPAKDPQAVLDYHYRIPLDAGDSVSSFDVEQLSGDVVIDNDSIAAAPDTTSDGYGQDVTIWLSGGTDGETAIFRVSWITTLTREDDAIILLPVAADEITALLYTGYMKPSPAHLIARYPAFAAVDVGTIRAWLSDAERFVTNIWDEGDYAPGLMSLAAHNMALQGLGSSLAGLGALPAGVNRLRSGSLDVSFTNEGANALVSGGYAATRYGQEYELLLRRNRGGPLVSSPGLPPEGALPDVWPV